MDACTQTTLRPEAKLTFRNSRIIYYGPHACGNCGAMICKAGHEFGGNAFSYPEGLIYPNTEWHPHICDPKRAAIFHPPVGSLDAPSPMCGIYIENGIRCVGDAGHGGSHVRGAR